MAIVYNVDQKKLDGMADGRKQITFEKYAERFLELIAKTKDVKPKTVQFYEERTAALLKYKPLKSALLSKIDAHLIDDYRIWRSETTKVYAIRKPKGESELADTFRPVAVSTINGELTTLRRILNKARNDRHYFVSDVKIRVNRKAENRRDRILTKAEEDEYLEKAPELLKDFAIVALGTGMRPDSEICALRWEDVSFKEGSIQIREGKTENARRKLYMTSTVKATLRRRHKEAKKPDVGLVFAREDGTAVPYSTIDSQHDRLMDALEWEPRATIYDFRHTCLTRMQRAGVDVFDLMKAAGHAELKTTQRYIQHDHSRQQEAFRRLEAFNQKAEAKTKQAKPRKKAAGA